ncbi:MAG: dual specificity protein phosphatase family protein [Thaumarchaeota archaeon]|nr:dual specificity protein phosphatase family protein [Nitrososphaerota archaeon]
MGATGVLLRKLRAKISDEPTGFSWVEEGKLAASGLPASRSQVRWLTEHGVNSILSLTEAPLPERWIEGVGIDYKHVPMKDHGQPSVEELREATSYVNGERGRGRVVLVHCLAGKGRTGCVLATLMILDGKPAGEAIKIIRTKRPGSIESGQENALFDFAASVG